MIELFARYILNKRLGVLDFIDGLGLGIGKSVLPSCDGQDVGVLRYSRVSSKDDLSICVEKASGTYERKSLTGDLVVDSVNGISLFPETTTQAAYLTLNEATNNGSNYTALVGAPSASSNRTIYLPDASGTLALYPTATLRQSSTTVANGGTGSPSLSCSAGEIAVGVGCQVDSGTSSTVIARARFDSTTSVLCTYANTSGATRTITVQAMCLNFG